MNKICSIFSMATFIMIVVSTVDSSSAGDAPKVDGADLYVDLAQYVGKEVLLIDGEVSMTDTMGATLRSGGVVFKIVTDGIDRETFRYILKHCSSIELMKRSACQIPLYVTPTGQVEDHWAWGKVPVLRDVRMAK
jgi:hypothetical protein